MDKKDKSNLGEQIRSTVQSAIDSRDFNQLNRMISDSVNSALEEARNQLVKGSKGWTQTLKRTDPGETGEEKRRTDDGPGYRAFQTSSTVKTGTGRQEIKINQQGRVSGILLTVFGSLFLGFNFIALLAALFISLILKPVAWAAAVALVSLLAIGTASGFILFSGLSITGRLKRARIYAKHSEKRMYSNLEELAASVGKSREYVLKDVEKMMKLGIFPHAYLDEQKTCLILSEATYNQYLECQKALKEREKEARLNQITEEAVQENQALQEIMAQGRNYLRVLKEANDAIPGEVISRKISMLEDVIQRIFDTVLKHPEQMGEIERFMDYYLPTTAKLVNAYRDFDSTGIEGNNILNAKKEIEGTLDTINQAFERLLDDLYQDTVMDITTDASVLQTMLKKDGWAESDFTGGMKE
ncbi:5-bromo-4-chloroindolyl phosphate hydrolysis family protein [Clostridium boliviensis]|uniref:5-bromo-4-chloroindolyl phosphate hydrolysis family protein n=1 Tax=Clostridium boliviensis TaxID=318465 RepID=A0ABU4GQ60_9CLOT|nr:5-bromo-4-chloroindolyl phosphate hydrolysis family protein [Clostridium boliviensis]MDW2799741.1 5-bromo-4-chloroindolyl phosphate hydrolysis family protein [Clostridium boliviensis]